MTFKRFLIFIFLLFSLVSNAQSTASKQVTTFTIEAPQLQTQKTIWIYLPKNYQNSNNAFSVIYMHDAQNLFDDKTSYVGEWHVDEFLDTLTARQSIIVGIEHGGEKRIDELTPYTHEKYGGGKGDNYLAFIVNTLKPYIDSNYRTIKDTHNTTIFGSSLGGLISFYGVIKFPETFGNAGVFSPAFWINPEIFDLLEKTKIPETSRFYFLAGTDEGESMIPNLNKTVDLLISKGVELKRISINIEEGKHNEKFWSEHFPNAYHWLTNTKTN